MPPEQKNLAIHVLADLRAQRDELLAEFQHWRDRAGEPGVLAQHRSQVVRISEIIAGLLSASLAGGALALVGSATAADAAESAVPGAAEPDPAQVVLGPLLALRRPLGAAHFFWDFFRDKFAQRDTAIYADHLGAADALAWHLYRPFWEAVVTELENHPERMKAVASPEQLKEPPLTFYHVERTLMTQPRASVFRPPGLDAKDVAAYSQALARLPIPIIGLPWYQARRMPALVFVGHEVGHVVSDDLGLGDQLDDLIAGLALTERRQQAWLAWRDEVFADVFGALALGSAYLEQLAVELAAERQAVIGERIRDERLGSYPTSALRIALCRGTLRHIGLSLPDAWYARAFPLAGDSDVYGDDVAAIVQAMIDGPYPTLGGIGLRSVLPWAQDDEQQVDEIADRSLAGESPDIAGGVRHWVAGAVRARMRDPSRYQRLDLDGRLAARIASEFAAEIRADACDGVRARLQALVAPATGAGFMVPPPSLSERDQQLGRVMAQSLGLTA